MNIEYSGVGKWVFTPFAPRIIAKDMNPDLGYNMVQDTQRLKENNQRFSIPGKIL